MTKHGETYGVATAGTGFDICAAAAGGTNWTDDSESSGC